MDEETLLAILAVCLKKKETETKIRKRKLWMKDYHKTWTEFTYQHLKDELREAPSHDFRNFLIKADGALYKELLDMLDPYIKKKDTIMRDAIPASQRFSTTLRFLATGRDFENLKNSSDISAGAVSKIVFETCEAIITCLQDYMKLPQSPEEWEAIAQDFHTKWNFPNCLGAVDNTHIAIQKPAGSGSLYYNYRKNFSVVLTAVVDANCEFLVADIGINGRTSDEQAFGLTSFGKALKNKDLNIPDPGLLPLGSHVVPYVFVDSDPIQPLENLMRPFAEPELSYEELIYNYRLIRASQVAENALGILTTRFGVFQQLIRLIPDKVQLIVRACCHLYNFLCRKTNGKFLSKLADREDLRTGLMASGPWRDVTELTPLEIRAMKRNTGAIEDVRKTFMRYFNNEGQVAWQELEIDLF